MASPHFSLVIIIMGVFLEFFARIFTRKEVEKSFYMVFFCVLGLQRFNISGSELRFFHINFISFFVCDFIVYYNMDTSLSSLSAASIVIISSCLEGGKCAHT